MLSIEELSSTISKRLDAFWSVDIDANNKVDADLGSESDNKVDRDGFTTDCDIDEEFDLNDNLDVIHNVNTSTDSRLFWYK